MNNSEDIELLTLVLVNALHLHIKQRSRIDLVSSGLLDEIGQSEFVLGLDVGPFCSELFIIDKGLQFVQQSQVRQEFMTAKLLRNESGQGGIGLVKPATRGDTVGDVHEPVRSVDIYKVFEKSGLEEIRVQLSHTVDLVRSNDCQISHAHHLGVRLLNNGDTR